MLTKHTLLTVLADWTTVLGETVELGAPFVGRDLWPVTGVASGAPESVVDAEIMDGLTSAFPGAVIRMGTEWTLNDTPYRVVVGAPDGTNPTDLVEVARRVGQTIDAALVQVAGRRDHESASNPIQENKPHA